MTLKPDNPHYQTFLHSVYRTFAEPGFDVTNPQKEGTEMISTETLERVTQLVREHQEASQFQHQERLSIPQPPKPRGAQAKPKETAQEAQEAGEREINDWTDALVQDEEQEASDERKENHHYQQLLGYVGRLGQEDRRDLVALCWLGRNEFDTFAQARQHACTLTTEGIGEYLSDRSHLSEYLARGLAQFRERG